MPTPKNISPEILALRDEHKAKVSELKCKQRSAAILKTILEKRLPGLTMGDREKLMDALVPNTTPSIPILHVQPKVLASQLPKTSPKLPTTPTAQAPRPPAAPSAPAQPRTPAPAKPA